MKDEARLSEHEEAFVRVFIVAQKRERYFGLMSSAKRRRLFRTRIAHALVYDLDARYLHDEDTLDAATARSVGRLFQASKARALCHVMAEDDALDGNDMTFAEAERQWDALNGILISVVSGQLVYYRPERPNRNYVLFKQPRAPGE